MTKKTLARARIWKFLQIYSYSCSFSFSLFPAEIDRRERPVGLPWPSTSHLIHLDQKNCFHISFCEAYMGVWYEMDSRCVQGGHDFGFPFCCAKAIQYCFMARKNGLGPSVHQYLPFLLLTSSLFLLLNFFDSNLFHFDFFPCIWLWLILIILKLSRTPLSQRKVNVFVPWVHFNFLPSLCLAIP